MSLMEMTDVSTSRSNNLIHTIHPAYCSAFLICVYAKMFNFELMLLYPLLNALPLTLSLSVSLLSNSLSLPFCFAYKPLANLSSLSLITIKSSDKHRCFTQRAEHNKRGCERRAAATCVNGAQIQELL
jgi:hypothetical protein